MSIKVLVVGGVLPPNIRSKLEEAGYSIREGLSEAELQEKLHLFLALDPARSGVVEGLELRIDSLIYYGQVVHLFPLEYRDSQSAAAEYRLYVAVKEFPASRGVLDVYIVSLRKKLRNLSVPCEIKNERGIGFRIEKTGPTT